MKRLIFVVLVALFCAVPMMVAADEPVPAGVYEIEIQNDSGHRYLVDGIRSSDLLPMQSGIFENLAEGRKFGLFVFAVLLGLAVILRIVKKFLHTGLSGDSRRDDMLH